MPPNISLTTLTPSTSILNLVQVTSVVDGDTIDVNIDGRIYTVRYIGIDTPKTVHPNIGEEFFGKEASNKNYELVAGKLVRLEKDVSETDKYGRLLRYVYVGDLFVNAELVRLGYVQVSTYPPDVKYQSLFLQLQQEARASGTGLWGITSRASTIPITPTLTPTQSDTLSLQILSMTSPVNAASNATLVAQTLLGTNCECEITVYYKSGPSSAMGLSRKMSDTSGRVSWTWKVGTNTTPGNWQIVVKATYEGKTVSQSTLFTV